MHASRIWSGVYFCSVALLVALILYPVRSGPVRLLMVGSLVVVVVGACFWIRNRQARAVAFCLVLLASLAMAVLPGRAAHQAQLQAQYVQALRSYEGDNYVWGGENSRGVDCSGIVRAAWIDAQVHLGIKTANPRLMRSALST